ncbi:hypothetical protein [Bradyrhizobium sp. C9]|uniref:hypothetical protein n=1 Tax=Bradyrhizobium sp. C9 TaxID=142585 RepID=UPI001177EB11|nr:hypothetical protein [Bradyrhizobium sp. C9]
MVTRTKNFAFYGAFIALFIGLKLISSYYPDLLGPRTPHFICEPFDGKALSEPQCVRWKIP